MATLLTALVSGLTLVACGNSAEKSAAARTGTAAVAVSGSGVTVDVVASSSWSGGFNGAVRITDTAFASPISSFQVVFQLAGGAQVVGTGWNGTISAADASGNRTATNPDWLQYQPIKAGQTWEVGFSGSGNFTSSTVVSVKINGQTIPIGGPIDNPPTVSLATSAATVTAAGSITLTATASDDKGLTKVEILEGSTLLASCPSSPCTASVSFTAAANGTHSYTARATDTAAQTASATVAVTVNIGTDQPPAVSLASSSTNVTVAGSITLTATASDDKGVGKVEFYDGATLLATDTAAPYTFTVALTAANNGTHSYTARAYDTINQATTSAAVAVTVAIGTDRPPTVSLASSATSVTAAGNITLTATASDDKGVSKVEFYDGTTLLATDTATPYVLTVALTAANNGTHSYTARAYDTINQATTSAAVSVNVNIATDRPPTVSLASSSTSVTAAGNITLTATASDDKGVTKVEFYDGGALLGTDTASPYTQVVALTSDNNGSHAYTAKAYDTINQSTTSAPVGVSVNIGGGPVSYALDPPDVCYNQYWVAGCESGACGGRCQVANACSPPEDPQKAALPMTFACPRFMMYSDEMAQAAKDDWGDSAPFVYGVVGHDADQGGLDVGTSSCCQCYQLIFERPEPGSPQPPDMPIPKPMIVQSFNTAAGGGKNFDIFMGAGGFGAFNACVPGSYSGTATTTFGHFMYSAFPSDYPGQGGIKAINIPECKVNGTVTAASMQSAACQSKIASLCNNTAAPSAAIATETKNSCIQTNAFTGFYHQNWQIRAKRVECPVGITKVTGCRLQPQGLPTANPSATTAANADSSFRTGYTTTTMQDCCKPSCAWQDQVTGAGLKVVDRWNSFYSCDQNGVPITAP